ARAAGLQAGNAEPPDGLLTRLIRVEVDGRPLTARQLRALVRNLITGGVTTTTQLLGNVIHEVLMNQDLETSVRKHSAALAMAIEESLRLRPPVMFIVRGCVADTEVSGCPVHDGERLIVGSASAN